MQQISHKQSLFRIFFAIILLLSTLPIFSQGVGQYPVQVSTVVLPNPPMYLSAYSGVETDKLSVTLLNRDTQQSSLQVKLRMRIYCSQGQEISSRAESLYTPITLEGGIPLRLSMSDLAAYFRTENLRIAGSLPQGKLPVGHTRFCFEVLEYYTGRLLSSQGCGSAFIVLQTPPLLQQPSHGSLLTDDPTGGILFRWSPQHSVGLERVQYEFILKEMFDTQQSAELGFAHGVEVYRTHTTATSLLYGMMQPPLIAGKRYVWQVRAFTDPISGTPLAFENNGQSRVFTFDIDYPCQAPQHIIATAHTNGIHLTWDASPHPSASYYLSYRRKDFSSTWHQAVTTSNNYTISNLTPGANYEYKVGISCTNKTNDIHYSTVAHIAYNPDDSETPPTSIQTKVKECGKSTPNNISNTEPKETLWAGDVIYAGDFTITLSTVQGSNGRFTGEGKVHVPYLSGIGMSVYFSDISINTDNQLIEGKIHTVYDESRGTIMNLDAFDHGGTTTPAQGVLVPTYKFDVVLTDVTRIHYDPLTNSLSFYDATGSRVGNYELTGTAPSFPILVSDKEGNMYSINETNKDNPPANYTLVAVGKQIGELAGNAFDRNVVDSHKGTVTFFDAGVGTYSFDEFLPPYDNINYIRYSSENGNERLYPQLGANYYVPWKFIPLNTHDKVQAKISLAPNSELQPERVVFITESGTQVPASYNASNLTYQVSVTGTSNSGVHTLYALYPKGDGTSYFHLGQLRIDSRPPQHLKLVLVYAGGSYDKTAVANELNTIYNRVGIHWQVSEVQNFTYDKATIKTLFDKKSGLLSAYNDRMTSLNQALQSHLGDSYQADACYVFMADASQAGTGRDVVGFMPRGRQYGYIYTKDLNASKIGSILAHELAHGKFKLYHTFDNIYAGKLAQGSTTNLMDYTGGTHLAKWQWNQLYDPAILNGVFDRDEDGEYSTDGHYYTVQLVALMMGFEFYDAYKLGAEAENPDSYVKNPWDMEERYTWMKAGLQQEYHALTGRKHGIELALTTYALLITHKNESNFHQYLLHRFGDCFGHINTRSTTFNTNVDLNDYVKAVDKLFNDYVKPKIKNVNKDNKIIVDMSYSVNHSIKIEKTMEFLKIYYDGKNLLTTLSIEDTKKELIQQLLHSYSEDVNLNFSHNLYLRNELTAQLYKLLPTAIQNDYDMYGNDYTGTKGHMLDNFFSYSPDDIGKRKELYFYYVNKLIDLLTVKYSKQNINKAKIIKHIQTIINNATDGTYEKRLDGILAFECEYYKNPNATSYEFYIPIKYNPSIMLDSEKAVDALFNNFSNDSYKQRDIMLSYLANRLIIDKIAWKPENVYVSGGLDRNNYPKYVYTHKPEVITNGKYDISIIVTTDKKSLKIKLTKK